MAAPVLTAAATAALEAALNTALRYDPGTRLALQKLAGQALAIEVTRPVTLALCVSFHADHVSVSHNGEAATTRLRGSLAGLAGLALGEHTTLARSGVEALGSTALLTDVQHLLRQLDLDWEELLADLLGDAAAHPPARLLRSGLNWTRQRAGSGRRLLQEFLTEELQATPSRHELSLFNSAVDQLRLQLDRAEAHLHQLQRLAAARTPASSKD